MRLLLLAGIAGLLTVAGMAWGGAGAKAPLTPDGARVAPASGTQSVYASAFNSGKSGAQWSNGPIEKCPSGKRMFLGEFSSESTTLALDNLPDHARVRISFDLLIMLSWDGDLLLDNPNEVGPDSINVSVVGGPRLLNASFVIKPSAATSTQSFPGMFPYDHVAVGTSALESGSLGFVWGGAGPGTDDYVYHVERTFGHSGKSLKVAFSGIHLQGKADESWGLDNVKVEVLPATAPGQNVDARALEPLWSVLAAEDPKPAVAAIATLVNLGDAALPEIRKHKDLPAPSPDRDEVIRKLIGQLDSGSFELRERASSELKELTPSAGPALRAALKQETLPMEARSRIEALVATMNSETPQERRIRRLVEVLELMNTPESRRTLADIAEHSTSFIAYEAKAAGLRLDGKAAIPTKLELPAGLPPPPAVHLPPETPEGGFGLPAGVILKL